MTFLVCLLEERSADAMLQIILSKLLPDNVFLEKSIVFEGKQDLERNLTKKLKFWNKPDTLFIVMRDQDSEVCVSVKDRLKLKVLESGKSKNTLIRVACRELESFYLGDLEAVEKGLKLKGLKNNQNKKKFRSPDDLNNAKQELIKLSDNGYQPISGSKAISHFLTIDGSNTSSSFKFLVTGVERLVSK